MKRVCSILLLTTILFWTCATNTTREISVKTVQDKIYASWLAQIIGNIYGLPHENAHINDPGPETFPYGYGRNTEYLKRINGAFSDDDTDFEYMYLMAMEKYGPEPKYQDLADMWMYHVRNRVWLANRAALAAMHYGNSPPVTGMELYNPHWFQIDPQLVNEIWAVTSPGMISYAAAKSDWVAQITNDGWGVEPTMHYGAMYAAAFFESDVNKLIDIGVKALPPESHFAKTIQDMKELYKKYPQDWKSARKDMADKYYHNEPTNTKTIWNANLNGACGILALLYGQGDFQKTLDLSCAMGFDADNQAATMSGLLGIIIGTEGLPDELLFPLKDVDWKLPFNDLYKNVSRHDMPDASLKDMAARMSQLAEKIILMNGGQLITKEDGEYYQINAAAHFTAPLEIPSAPMPYIEVGQPLEFTFLVVGGSPPFEWSIKSGSLPEGLTQANGKVTGIPEKPGVYPVTMEVNDDGNTISKDFNLVVRNRNISGQAKTILANVKQTHVATRDSMWLSVPYSLYNNNVSAINDGIRFGDNSTFYSIDGTTSPKVDYYGYEWENSQHIGLIDLSTGSVEENGGWFTSLGVEYRDKKGKWRTVKNLVITPDLLDGETRFDKAHFAEYLLSFDPVNTTAVRIIGDAGNASHWRSTTSYFTSVAEITVHAPLPEPGLAAGSK